MITVAAVATGGDPTGIVDEDGGFWCDFGMGGVWVSCWGIGAFTYHTLIDNIWVLLMSVKIGGGARKIGITFAVDKF